MTSQFTTQADQHRFKTRDAESYDSVVAYFDRFTERFSAHMPAPLLAMANVPADGVVLDVGTGTGIVALGVAAGLGPAGKVVGIDLSDGMLATAEQKAKRTGLGDRTEFIRMDAEDLSFADNSFDACLSLYALRHFPNPEKSVNEIFRVLKPGARIVVAVGSPPPLFSLDGAKAAFRRLASAWRTATGRELSACGFIDSLVEEFIPAGTDRDIAQWGERHHGFTGSVKELVRQAGFGNIRTGWKGQYATVDSVDDFWFLQMTFSSIARKRLQRADDSMVRQLKTVFYQRCEQVLEKNGRLVYQTGASIVAGIKPPTTTGPGV